MDNQIKHMVIFSLIHQKDSSEAIRFLTDGQALLASIPVVKNFQVFKQISQKNDFDFGFSMVFDNAQDYDTYSNHPVHRDFVTERWKREVARFLEIDCQPIFGHD